MKHKIVFAIAALLFCTGLAADDRSDFERAVQLMDRGMYDAAGELFARNSLPLALDYQTLCAVRSRSPRAAALVDMLPSKPASSLRSRIHFEWGAVLFSRQEYAAAIAEFDKVKRKHLDQASLAEYYYKQAFSEYSLNPASPKARESFVQASLIHSEYQVPSYFALAQMDYRIKDFSHAASRYALCLSDERFAALSEFYLLDCQFMLKNYDYVLEKGESVYKSATEERKAHIARMLSETYLLKGMPDKARLYLNGSAEKSNSDYFHAASVYYAVGDYRAAISNFDKMSVKTDSLAQIASYQKAYSYIKLNNKVQAMAAFKNASELSYDAAIKEDAFFNYALLSFDLNSDDSVFMSYIERYGLSYKGEMIYDYLALSALRRKDWAAAVQAYDNIDELNADQKSNYIKANYLRAAQLLSHGSYTAAVPYLRAAAWYLPKDSEFGQLCRYTLADTYYNTDSYDDALRLYNELYNLSALSQRKEGYLIPYNMAWCHFKAGDYDKAAKYFDIYLSSGNTLARADALLRRADCDFVRKDYDAAAKAYDRLLKAYPNPDFLYPYYNQGMAYYMTGNNARRIQSLQVVKKASPKSEYYCECLYELGRAYSDASDKENALSCFELLHKNAGSTEFKAKALLGKGMVLRNNAQYDQALACYKQVVSQMRESKWCNDALLSIKSIYTAMKTPEKYLDYLEANKLSLGQSSADKQNLYYDTAEQVFLAGNWKGALNSFNKYLELFPNGQHNADALYYIAASYKNLGQKDKARDFYAKAMEGNLDSSFRELALMEYANLSYSLEHFEDAFKAYDKLCGKDYPLSSKQLCYQGAMRSAFRAKLFNESIAAADNLLKFKVGEDLKREATYVKAKSYLQTSRRSEAFELLGKLIQEADTPEGAESYYLIIQARFDWGNFDGVENGVYDFAQKCGDQSYWLAKAYIVLGDSFAARSMKEQAIATFQSLLDGYTPAEGGDDIIPSVQEKLSKIQ